MNINEATEIASRGYNNTLNNSQRVLVDAYIQIVLEDESLEYQTIIELSELFDNLLDKLQ